MTYRFLLLFSFIVGMTYGQSTASKNIEIFSLNSTELDTLKTIWVYTPTSYTDDSLSYPVVYMFDGQNLFDNETSFVGEWGVDEYLDQSHSDLIIVGIEHGNRKRLEELTPFPNHQYGGGKADAMIDFIIKTLKPRIDSSYRTKTDARYTSIAGSSLGGLSSFYAAWKHPDVFGNAGVFSPSFWINPELFDDVRDGTISTKTRFFFTVGTAESETMVPDLEKMVSLLVQKGMSLNKIQTTIVEDAEHNETFWSSQLPSFMEWLLKINQNRFYQDDKG